MWNGDVDIEKYTCTLTQLFFSEFYLVGNYTSCNEALEWKWKECHPVWLGVMASREPESIVSIYHFQDRHLAF